MQNHTQPTLESLLSPCPTSSQARENPKTPASTNGEGVKTSIKRQAKSSGLVNAYELINTLWRSGSRPSIRFIREHTANGDIPSVRIGNLTFYKIADVRASFSGVAPKLSEVQVIKMTNRELSIAFERLQGERARRVLDDALLRRCSVDS